MDKKFKKVIATGLAAATVTTVGGMAVKHHKDNTTANNNQNYIEYTLETYTVKEGDTLTGICDRYYGDAKYETALRLAAYNKIDDADRIRVGQIIEIPSYEVLMNVRIYPYPYEIDEGRKR